MDRGKRPNKFLEARNNKIYMDLKDIIREHALPFLPAKALFRFRKVCRDWKLQISTPFFAHNQSLSCSSISGLFFQNRGEPPSFLSLDPEACGIPDPCLKFLPVPVDVKSSSNGLLCCQGQTGDRAYYICNPVTRQWTILPKSDMDHGADAAVVLIFKPSLLNFVVEYKLVCAFRSNDFDDAIEFDIYSSKEGTWKTSGDINFAFKKSMPGMGIHANDVVYWPGPNGYLLAYDLAKERSETIAGYHRDIALGMVEGKLCRAYVSGHDLYAVELFKNYSKTMIMDRSYKSKSAKRHATLDIRVVGNSLETYSVPFIGGNMAVVQIGKNLFSCDLNTSETKRLPSGASLYEGKCLPYVNSLASL